MINKIMFLMTGIFLIVFAPLVIGQTEMLKSETEIGTTEPDNGGANEDRDDHDDQVGFHDPFHLPKKKILSHQIPGGVQVGQWHLTGIIVGSSGKRLAILNDRLVSEGDKVWGGQIDRIYPDSVVIKGPFGTRELKMLSFSSEGPPE